MQGKATCKNARVWKQATKKQKSRMEKQETNIFTYYYYIHISTGWMLLFLRMMYYLS